MNGQDKGDATDDEDKDEDEDADNRDEDEDDDKVMDQYPSEDISDKDVETKEDEWGTLFTDKSDGIFKQIVNAVGERSAKISHDFATTAWACSVQPQIMVDVEERMTGYHRKAIE